MFEVLLNLLLFENVINRNIEIINFEGSELFDVSLEVLPCQCVASSDDGQKSQPSHGDIVTIGLSRNNVDEVGSCILFDMKCSNMTWQSMT